MTKAGGGSQVTRALLAKWGFLPLPDVWLSCPSEGRHKYFERWYHAGWNYTAVIGWPGKDPLEMREEDFLAFVQAHMCQGEALLEHYPWDEAYPGT